MKTFYSPKSGGRHTTILTEENRQKRTGDNAKKQNRTWR